MTMTVGVGIPFTLARWEVKPGNEAAFIEAWDRFAEWTAGHQAGAMVGVLLQDATDPRRFVSYGPWAGTEQIAAWRGTPEFRDAFTRFGELCTAIEPHVMTCVAVQESSV